MLQQNRNIYQIARESKGLTQEKAAELLDVSVESLRAYESGRRIPPDKIVLRMIEVYGTPHLAYQHLKTNIEVGQVYLPNIEVRDLPTAILKVQKEVTDFLKRKDELIEIASDGVIDESERPQFDQIMKELEDICAAVFSLKFAKPIKLE